MGIAVPQMPVVAAMKTPPCIEIVPPSSVRFKVTDRCPWNCWFCHNEGTGERDPTKVLDVRWDSETKEVITRLKEVLQLKEIHLTGGEPMINPHLPELVNGISQLGLDLKATTTGCSRSLLEQSITRGLRSLNFSLHATEPRALQETQRNREIGWTRRQLRQEMDLILEARELGASVKIQTVVAGESDLPRAHQVLDWAQHNQIPVRFMKELGSGDSGTQTILGLLQSLNAALARRVLTLGSSNMIDLYRLPSGYEVGFKRIAPVYLTSMCSGCRFQGSRCPEKFYGIRLEMRICGGKPRHFVRLCLQRNDPKAFMPIGEFLSSLQLAEMRVLSGDNGTTGIAEQRAHAFVPLGAACVKEP
jgi:cyclic pyranopterin phosphate synthase